MARKTGWIVIAGAVLALSAAAHGADVTIPGKISLVKPAKLAKFLSKSAPGSPFPLPAAGSAEDPTLSGAQLRVFDTEQPGAGEVSFLLDQSGWTALGVSAGSTAAGYKYKGKDDILDPDPSGTCKIVLLKEKIIKAVCKGSAVALTTPFSASEGIRLGIPAGTASLRYCATFGGDESSNNAALMKRTHAPAPDACAGVPQDRRPCGDTELACHGECPVGQVCTVNPIGPGSCECAPESAVPCEDTGGFPAPNLCGGNCPDGLACATIDFDTGSLDIFCGCIPSDAVACAESSAPACGGICPPGLTCQSGGLGNFSCVCQ